MSAQLLCEPRAAVAERTVVRFLEVPLNYNGTESTILITNGSSPLRVILHTAVTGKELREFCLGKGWRVKDRDLVVTDHEGRQTRHKAAVVDDVLISPTAKQGELTERAGAKG